jgi:hypothetical protein
MCIKCASGTQAAYQQESNTKASEFTNNIGSSSSSDSINETGLPNGQDKKFEGLKAQKSTPNQAEKTGWGN